MHSRVPIRTYTHDICAVWIVRVNLNINNTIVEVDARRAIRRFNAIKHQPLQWILRIPRRVLLLIEELQPDRMPSYGMTRTA